MPQATAPASIHAGTSSTRTPPVGMIGACGTAARTSASQPGPNAEAGNSFTASAPCSNAVDAATARMAVLAGARFLVSPSLHAEVISTAHRYGVAALPGAATPTEIAFCSANSDSTSQRYTAFPSAVDGFGGGRQCRQRAL
jgi:hypothetical protein